MKYRAIPIALLTMGFLAGCAGGSASFCDIARPIYLDSLTGKTETEKRDILAHNLKGKKLCGWKTAKAK